MASRRFDPLKTLGVGRVTVFGTFFPNGAVAGLLAGSKGRGYSVSRVGLGLYTVTLTDVYFELMGYSFDVQEIAGADWTAVMQGAINLSTGQFNIQTRLGGGAADLPANAANSVSFMMYLRNTAIIS